MPIEEPRKRLQGIFVSFEPYRYLTSELPTLLHAVAHRVDREAVIQLSVTDRDDCDVILYAKPNEISVVPGIADDAEVCLSMSTAELDQLAQGKLDAANAVRGKRIRITGSELTLSWLSGLLSA